MFQSPGSRSTRKRSTSGVYAPLNSPAFTGTPTAPTASVGTNTTQIATTAFVATSFAGFDSSSTQNLTNYPIGSIILVYNPSATYTNRNQSASVYYSGSSDAFQTTSSGGTLLSGTWRARGSAELQAPCLSPIVVILFQRTA